MCTNGGDENVTCIFLKEYYVLVKSGQNPPQRAFLELEYIPGAYLELLARDTFDRTILPT